MAAVLDVKNGGISGSRSIDSEALLLTRKRALLTYVVLAADINESTDDILAATDLPQLRALQESGYVIEKVPREINSAALLWEVDIIIDSQIDVTAGAGTGGPTRVVEWRWSSESIDLVLPRDPISGEPFTNSVGEKIVVTAPVSIPILAVSRIEDTFSPNTILQYENQTNSQIFYGAPPGTALMADINDGPVDQQGTVKRQVNYIVKFNLLWDFDEGDFLGWKVQYLNQATKYLPKGKTLKPGNLRTAIDDLGNPTTVIVKESGRLNTDNEELSGNPLPDVYLTRNRFLQTDFGPLQLGPF